MRVLLADDQAQLRSAVRLLLDEQADIDTIGEAADLGTLQQLLGRLLPDLILLDWELPGMRRLADKTGLLATLRRENPRLQIIVLSGRPEASRSALAAGANAFVSKADPPEQLLAALRKAQQSSNMAR